MNDFGRDLVIWAAVYVAVLLLLGALGRRARRDTSLADFFLAGRGIGLLVLLLTLFATQYSGNSMSGFPGQTYRRGLSYFMSVPFMVGIVSGYLLFAPRLFALARRRRYITPSDYLAERFAHPWVSYGSAAIFAITLFNFLLAQLMALGHAFAGLTGGRIPFAAGVIGGALVILIYEVLGGMRAVAWTDALQGTLLMAGMFLIAGLLAWKIGGPAQVVAGIQQVAPAKLAIPNLQTCTLWLSNFLLLALGGPLYPQAIQRIYAARRLGSLRRALAAMAFLPLIAITTVIFIGAVGIVLFPNLQGVEADQVTFKVIAHLVEIEPLAYTPALVVLIAVLAAIMSTADSCLLSLSSIFTKDFIARARGLSEKEADGLTGWTPWISGSVLAVLVGLALLQPATLWNLLVIKFEILIQLSPAFVLGTLHDKDDPKAFAARDILAGLLCGLVLALGLYATGQRSLYGFHAGTLGVGFNYLVCWGCRSSRRARRLPLLLSSSQ